MQILIELSLTLLLNFFLHLKMINHIFCKLSGSSLIYMYLKPNKRGKELFLVKRAKTERLKKSSIISMQKLLNSEASKQKEIMTKINNYMPVNYDCM